MDRQQQIEFYSSIEWKKCREAYKKQCGGLCEECLKVGIISPAEIVHHKRPVTSENISDPKITLAFDNLMCLCREHHAQVHSKNKRRYRVDDNGEVSIL